MDIEKCNYCNGKPLVDKKPLMSNYKGDYTVFINRFHYLEDSEIGDSSKKFSLLGIKINFCPVCGRKLNEH